MIAGRPINLWLGVVTSSVGFLGIVLIGVGLDPEFVAQLLGALAALLGALVALVAGQPATVNPGDRITIHTDHGSPDVQATVDVAASGAPTVKEHKPE